ncbi:MAG: flagellar basal body P-ring formation chaperone FlgA [Alphaproteobacteria bacterium]
MMTIRIAFFLLCFLVDCSADFKEDVTNFIKKQITKDADFEITLLDNKNIKGNYELKNVSFFHNYKSFVLDIECPEKGAISIKGEIRWWIKIPVLKDTIKRNIAITEDDIEWQPCLEDRKTTTLITQKQDLIGKIPTRGSLKAFAPIHQTDVHFPSVLKRGDHVRIFYKTPIMILSTVGVAQKAAYIGDVIFFELLSTSSTKKTKKIIRATVLNNHEANIESGI